MIEFRKEQEFLSYKRLCQWAKSYGVTIQTKPLRVLWYVLFFNTGSNLEILLNFDFGYFGDRKEELMRNSEDELQLSSRHLVGGQSL